MDYLYDNIPQFDAISSGFGSFSTFPTINGGFETFGSTGNMINAASPNIHGGMDLSFDSGFVNVNTAPNVFGGQDFYSSSGELFNSTQNNIFGGVNHFDTNGSQFLESRENIFGGQDYFSDGQMLGSSTENIFGGYDYNFTDLNSNLDYVDPLGDIGEMNELGSELGISLDQMDLIDLDFGGELFDFV